MTREEHTVAVFAELQRIGFDADLVGGAPIATGFTRRSLLDWLRRIPSGAGSTELQHRLDEHARETLAIAERAGAGAEHDADRVDPAPNLAQVRWWPTTLMLDAGIDLLAEEWDPVGVRLDTVPPEDLGEYTFHLLVQLLHCWPGGDSLERVAGLVADIEGSRLGLRPSSPIHRRYLAARLREIVARYPLPVREPSPPGTGKSVMLTSEEVAHTGPPAIDPEGTCTRCQRFGTVARVTTHTEPPRTVRFCTACWREVRGKYMSTDDAPLPRNAHQRIERLDESRGPPTSAESRSWDDAVEFLRLVLIARDDPERGREITPALLAELASELAADADEMDGPMPEEIESFVREYSPPGSPPASASDQHEPPATSRAGHA